MADLLITRADDSGRLGYSITTRPATVRGISRLVQEIVVDLLSDFRPDLGRGSGLKSYLAQVMIDDVASANRVVSDAVSSVRSQILNRQNRTTDLAADERLSDLRVLTVSWSSAIGWDIKLELVPQSGGSVTLSLPEI